MQKIIDDKLNNYTQIYSDLYPLVYSTVQYKVNNEDDTEDICQEIFTRFYLNFEKIENPRKWIMGTMRYVILEHYKKNSNNPEGIEIDDVINDIRMSYVNGFRDTRIIIEEVLNNSSTYVDEKHRTLFELIAIKKLSYIEVAKELGMKKGQVRYKYRIIINRIIDHLKIKGIKSLEDLL